MTETVEPVDTDDGLQLWHARSGAGPPMVLCHGGPGLWDNLGPLAALIDDLAEVHRWEQRGCGRSSGSGPYTIARSIEDLEAVRRHVGVERWIVAGHSWGAELALHYAVAHPERTRSLLYLSGRGLMDSWRARNRAVCRTREAARTTEEQRRRLDALAALSSRTPDLEREFRLLSWCADVSPEADAASLLQADVDAPYEINFEANRSLGEDNRSSAERLRAALPALRCPTLLVHGVHDPRPSAGAEELGRLLPDATLSLVDAGHLPWLERPAEVRSILTEFLGAGSRVAP